jgi:hypothetical protein
MLLLPGCSGKYVFAIFLGMLFDTRAIRQLQERLAPLQINVSRPDTQT